MIDESKLKPAPSLKKRILDTIISATLSLLVIQGLLFYINYGSIVKYYDNVILWIFVSISMALGWFYGGDFIEYIKYKIHLIWKEIGY